MSSISEKFFSWTFWQREFWGHSDSFFSLFFSSLTDRAAQIELFHALAAIAAENNLGQGILVKIKFNIIASLYDYNPNLAAFMKVSDTAFNSYSINKTKRVPVIYCSVSCYMKYLKIASHHKNYLCCLTFWIEKNEFLSYGSSGLSPFLAWHVEEVSGLYRWAAGHSLWAQQHLHRREHRRGQRESGRLRSGDPTHPPQAICGLKERKQFRLIKHSHSCWTVCICINCLVNYGLVLISLCVFVSLSGCADAS